MTATRAIETAMSRSVDFPENSPIHEIRASIRTLLSDGAKNRTSYELFSANVTKNSRVAFFKVSRDGFMYDESIIDSRSPLGVDLSKELSENYAVLASTGTKILMARPLYEDDYGVYYEEIL